LRLAVNFLRIFASIVLIYNQKYYYTSTVNKHNEVLFALAQLGAVCVMSMKQNAVFSDLPHMRKVQ